MDPDSWIQIALLALAIALAAFAAAAEVALASVSRQGLRQVLAGRQPRAQAADEILEEPARFLSTLLVVKLLAFILATTATLRLAQRFGGGPRVVGGLVGLFLVLILTQLVPRAWALGHQDELAISVAPLLHVLAFLATPLTAPMRRIGQQIAPRGAAAESIFLSEDGLRFLLNSGEDETVIEDEEKEMIASIFQFGETLVREVMVPRIDIAALDVETPMVEAMTVILKAGHSRIPVYKDTIDNIVGMLYAKDLLVYLRDGRTDVPIGKILRSAYFIPESKKVDELLQELQKRHVHMAIVVDEYGGTAGLVTIEDLLEEIVGEIQDEYDVEEPTVEEVGSGEYRFDARVNLDEVNKLLNVELPAEGGDTLGGFIYSQLGKVPAVGDTIEYAGVHIEVLSVAGRRIKQVRVTRTAPVSEDGHAPVGPVAFTLLGFH
ncbi:MAG TPA: hemolysin family protein [Anaerolineae bacterium]